MTGAESGDHPQKPPFMLVRAIIVTVPLAVLVGAVVSPPDAVVQVIMIAGTLIGGLPITYRLVASRRYGPWQVGAFFGIVMVLTLLGLWVLQWVGSGPVPEILVRFGIVLLALFAADGAVFRGLGSLEA